MMTEQEIIEFAKQNDYCWAGLQRRHPEVAEWMEKHNSDCGFYLCECEPLQGIGALYLINESTIYRLRPNYEPDPKAGWRVYDVIANKGKYYVKDLGSCGGDVFLPNAIGRVGFGGVQFEGQHGDGWHMTPCFMDFAGGTYEFSENGDKPATPIRARFWEDAQ